MKIKNILLCTFVLGAMSLTSCNLDTEPDFAVPVDVAAQYPQDQLAGVLSNMYSIDYYGRNAYVLADVGTDDIVQGINTGGRFEFESRMEKFEAMSISGGSTYDPMYQAIENANQIINNPNTDGNIRGQAYFLRALATFDAVKFYSDVPIATEPTIDLDEALGNNMPNVDAAKVYAQVELDLDSAFNLITNTDNVNFPSRNAVEALRTRLYLFMAVESNEMPSAEAYQKVIDAADAVQGVTLLDTTNYPTYFRSKASNIETIFEIAVDPVQSRGSNNFGYVYFFDGTTGYGAYTANPEFVDLYDNSDIRKSLFVTIDSVNLPGYKYIYKFDQQEGVTALHSPKILRYSEVLLNKAEALAHLGDNTAAAAIIDLIRKNRYTNPNRATPATGDTTDVYLERRKELAYEGHRMFDLRRHGQPVTLVRLVDGAVNDDVQILKTVPAGDKQFWYPIPQRPILANPNLVQTKY
ncbi:RagB/SusD family nutrient uptake outer membrane protein [Persicobacter psychrovividus]|uniref:Membrane protein n=1 Tax=Persicobacter psychrovividus TaxID=387638 RepID=A0ABM7VJF2_9BACT|nr:membrane protein [Persicobacter psychrovividus]